MNISPLKPIKGAYVVVPETAKNWCHAHGQVPFVRGAYREMYQGKPWTIRQYAGFETASKTNAFFKRSLAEGQTGLSVAFDLPTHLGFDSDHPLAQADVGRTGVAIDSVEDMSVLFDGIDLAKVSVSMTMNGAVLPIMACFIVAAQEQGVPLEQLTGTIQNDILKEYIARNTYIHSPDFSLDVVSDVVAYCAENMPRFNSISISGYHFQEAGATPELELALTMANARTYLTHFEQRGIDIESVAKRLSFFFCVGMDFYKEIAKLRAARLLWSELLEEFGVHSSSAKRLKMHCQTSGSSLTEMSPLNNIVRTTIEAMAGVFGGTQSLHTNSYDEAISLPSDQASKVALDTQLILLNETGIGDVVDPWGGSYMMETATQNIVDYVYQVQQEIDEQGGVRSLVETGELTAFIHQHALQSAIAEENQDKTIIGKKSTLVASSASQSEPSVMNSTKEKKAINAEKTLSQQAQKMAHLKLKRNNQSVQKALEALKMAVRNKNNLMPFMIDAIRLRATVGECIQALTDEQARYHKPETIKQGSFKQALDPKTIDKFRILSENVGRKLRFLVAKVGLDGHDRGAKVIVSLLNDLGIEVDYLPVFSTPDDILNADLKQHYDCIGLSVLSGAQQAFVSTLLTSLRVDCPLVLGGVIPVEEESVFEKLGVDSVFTARHTLNDIAFALYRVLSTRLSNDLTLPDFHGHYKEVQNEVSESI
ncbi:methylmalonyl-CoA mutase family protein [Marinomonas sp. 5E14-1]|uniref:methylmalonyl-CoA mutase family protein n=1 Tax=Marinomonas sp. 5E14-1 TaxID=3153922 RepID=UPI0032650A31